MAIGFACGLKSPFNDSVSFRERLSSFRLWMSLYVIMKTTHGSIIKTKHLARGSLAFSLYWESNKQGMRFSSIVAGF